MTMARWQRSITDGAGNVVPGAHVEVRRDVPGQPLAALYSDRAGTVPLGNPFDADPNGFAAFHARGGPYQIRVYTGPSGAPTAEHFDRYVGVSLGSETDAPGINSRDELGNGDVSLFANDTLVFLKPTVAASRTVTIALETGAPVTVFDANGSWSDANVTTFIVQGGGTINGQAQWYGTGPFGSFEFTPRGDGNFSAR